MVSYKQLKVGPELLSPSGESWLGYYVFAVLALAIPGLGGYWVQASTLEGSEKLLVLLGIMILFLIAVSMCMICHFMGHIFDILDEVQAQQKAEAATAEAAPSAEG